MTDWYDWLDENNDFDGKKFSANNAYTSTVTYGLQEAYESLIVTDLSTRWIPKKKKRTALHSQCLVPTVIYFVRLNSFPYLLTVYLYAFKYFVYREVKNVRENVIFMYVIAFKT